MLLLVFKFIEKSCFYIDLKIVSKLFKIKEMLIVALFFKIEADFLNWNKISPLSLLI